MGAKKRIDPKLPIPASTDPESKPDSYQDRFRRRLNELFLDRSDTLSVYDEGAYLGEAEGVNLVGTAVVASANTSLPGVYDITVTGGSGGAPVDATYVVMSLDPTLTNERKLTAGTNITITDGGANGNVTISASGGATSPLTTKGDIWGFSTVDARIPVGQDNYVLIADSSQTLGVRYGPVPNQLPLYVYFA